MRHTLVTENDPPRGVSIATLAREYPGGSHVALHAHGSDQLVYASRGVMEVASGRSVWLLPPHFGLWIPARTPHDIHMPECVAMRTLYLRPGLYDSWRTCTVFHVAPLLRELIFEVVRIGKIQTRSVSGRALRHLVIAELNRASPVPTGVALPGHARALAVAQVVMGDPAIRRTLAAMCNCAGVSVRTLQRAFRREVGMDFESWRRQVRLMKGVHLLVSGRTVKEVAFAVGYQEPGAFVTLFRSIFGKTPKAWISALQRDFDREHF